MSFQLLPYPGLPSPEVRVSGEARRDGSVLHLTWRLDDPFRVIEVPGPATRLERRDGLWKATCFECFLGTPGRPRYREFNLSPEGHWNVYRFEAYRAGQAAEEGFQALPFTVARRPDGCDVDLRVDLASLGLGAVPWRLAVATVLEERNGQISYWALEHTTDQPDFHAPAAFVLPL